MDIKETILITRQLKQLRRERPNASDRFSAAQNFAYEWAVTNLVNSVSSGSEESEITIPSSWLNNCDRATAAAQQLVDNLPQLKHVKLEDPPQVEKVQQPSCGAITMNAQQLNDFVQSIMQNMQNMKLNNSYSNNHILPQDIGYFFPDNHAKDEVDFIDGKAHYHNVFNFTAPIKAKVTPGESGPRSSASVALKLDQCLKGKAELWYTNEISDTMRAGFKANHQLWCNELEARF
ncbi:hypothetical protein K3495_g6994 [Podosphaera aphanis]|nr:hypothetical protein K3495_g6994 [Podosphaera aphanis]